MNCHCDNCNWTGPVSALALPLEDIPDLAERLDPGSEVPTGECPECNALAYVVKERAAALPAPPPSPLVEPGERAGVRGAPVPRVVIIVDGGCVQQVFCSDATTRVEILDHDNADTPEARNTLCLQEAEAQAELQSVPLH